MLLQNAVPLNGLSRTLAVGTARGSSLLWMTAARDSTLLACEHFACQPSYGSADQAARRLPRSISTSCTVEIDAAPLQQSLLTEYRTSDQSRQSLVYSALLLQAHW